MREDAKFFFGEVAIVGLAAAVLLFMLFRADAARSEEEARAVRAADAWMKYADQVRAVACRPEADEGTTCLVVRSSGLVVTLRCDRGSTWECSPASEQRP